MAKNFINIYLVVRRNEGVDIINGVGPISVPSMSAMALLRIEKNLVIGKVTG